MFYVGRAFDTSLNLIYKLITVHAILWHSYFMSDVLRK